MGDGRPAHTIRGMSLRSGLGHSGHVAARVPLSVSWVLLTAALMVYWEPIIGLNHSSEGFPSNGLRNGLELLKAGSPTYEKLKPEQDFFIKNAKKF